MNSITKPAPIAARVTALIVSAIFAASLTSCSTAVRYRSPAVSAIAVDASTGKPIPGLTVSVSWQAIRRSANPHNPDMLDIHSATTVTDTNGAFVIPAWGPVSYPSGWRYFSNEPAVSFSKSGINLGYWDNLANGTSFDEIYAYPFQTVDFGKPSWNGQKLMLPQWKLDKPLW